MKLSADKTTAEISVAGTLDARELSDLISQLAALRSTMTPPVPERRDDLLGDHVTMEDTPEMTVAHLKDGRFRFWVRSAGFGWCAYNVDAERAKVISDYLGGKFGDDAASLIGKDLGVRH